MARKIYEIKELYSLTNLEAEILNLLLQNPQGMTAQEVSTSFPDRGENVYRPLDKLVKLGIVEKTDNYPSIYSAKKLMKRSYKDEKNRIFTLDSTISIYGKIRIQIVNTGKRLAKKIKDLIKPSRNN